MEKRTRATVSVRPLREKDVPAADRILREAFDTFTGVENLFGDRDLAGTRWRAAPNHAIGAESEERLVGSNFVTVWGSFGFFGPLSTAPAMWDRGVATGLLETTMDLFAAAAVTQTGLFTFPHSPKHLGLYQRFGFWPQHLTPVMRWPAASAEAAPARWQRLSALDDGERASALRECRALADEASAGLDLTREIRAVHEQGLGDTVLLQGDRLDGFAVCHTGAGSEAGSNLCYVKFALLRPGLGAPAFDSLLDAVGELARRAEAAHIEAGVNTACRAAYGRVLARGARAGMVGVAMNRPDGETYNRPELFLIGDWR